MWRPVALSAFLALLFMSSRSGQEPVETQPNDVEKTDFGASASQEKPDKDALNDQNAIKVDLSKASTHAKTDGVARTDALRKTADTQSQRPEDDAAAKADEPQAIASLGNLSSTTIPLPVPKTDASATGTRVVVTQGEQKTALTSDEEALRLMPPGPDFAAKVQKELARLGCYRGRVDNIWGPMSRRAVARFNRVAEAKLPLKQPTRALLSSARKAPDEYCNGGGNAASQVASLDPNAGLEELKSRPSYLPPWMRGEPMPEVKTQAEQAEAEPESEAEATPRAGSTDARERRTKPRRAQRTRTRSHQAQRRRVQRRQVRRRSTSLQRTLQSSDFNWPGQ